VERAVDRVQYRVFSPLVECSQLPVNIL
jgi:hypothetical protein